MFAILFKFKCCHIYNLIVSLIKQFTQVVLQIFSCNFTFVSLLGNSGRFVSSFSWKVVKVGEELFGDCGSQTMIRFDSSLINRISHATLSLFNIAGMIPAHKSSFFIGSRRQPGKKRDEAREATFQNVPASEFSILIDTHLKFKCNTSLSPISSDALFFIFFLNKEISLFDSVTV